MQTEDFDRQEPFLMQDAGGDRFDDVLLSFGTTDPYEVWSFSEHSHLTPRVLVVDDDQSIGELLKMALETLGFSVRVALSAEAGFWAALEFDPDIVLADYLMPVDDGTRLRERMQADPRVKHIPFTLMSCGRQRLPSMQGVPFLPKPFDLSDVVSFVERYRRHKSA